MGKVILVDVDGVLLNWEYAFGVWMMHKGYKATDVHTRKYDVAKKYGITTDKALECVKDFNGSASMGFIPPLRDAVQYVRALSEDYGYEFHVISSLSEDEQAHQLRTMNLKKLFGERTFSKFEYIGLGLPKTDILADYEGSGYWWIEDRIDHALDGLELGLKPIIMHQGHNSEYDVKNMGMIRVYCWQEIFEIVQHDEITKRWM